MNAEQKNIGLTIALMGDIAPIGLISTDQENNPKRFKEPSKILSGIDLPVANLEVPVRFGDELNEYKERHHFSEVEATLQVLRLLNIKMVSLANNHIYDCKMSGLQATIDLLEKSGIKHTGAGWKPEHLQPAICESKGKKIALLAYVDKGTNPKTEHFPELYLNYFNIDKTVNDIQTLKGNADLIIVSLHWGVDYSFYPTKTQKELARRMIDAGADIIMGHHPHTLQPFEVIKGKYVFYSLGGLTFGDYLKNGRYTALFRKTKKSVIALYHFDKKKTEFLSTKELIGNYIKITNRNFEKWSEKLWKYYSLKNKNKLFNSLVIFHDTVIFRLHEYFFGYYKNPVKRLVQVGNVKKISKLMGDYKRNKSKKL